MTDKEAMKMALDALEANKDHASYESGVCSTIEALREVLAQPEQKEQWANGYKAGYAQAQETDLAMPRKEWVGLTKEEVGEWVLPDAPTVFGFVKFVEAKLKEKNT